MPALPHIYPVGATMFITFRLADSLPLYIVQELKCELEEEIKIIRKAGISTKEADTLIYNKKKQLFGRFDYQLDAKPYGNCYLDQPSIAQLLFDKIMSYHTTYYDIHALSIMPNHVHLLADTSIQLPEAANNTPKDYVDVSKWMQLIKGGSAFLINQQLGRSGKLWSKESYDHFVRYDKEGEYDRIRNYILSNPTKAGLGRRYSKEPYLFELEQG